MKIRMFFIALFFTFLSVSELYNNVLFKAMEDELNRSISKLKIEKQDKPYYISYRVRDMEFVEIKAEFGSLLNSNQWRDRDIYVDLRVGNYEFDNSNFVCRTGYSRIIGSDYTKLPLEDNYDAIRKDIWLVTDGTYKRALEKLSRKKATIQNQQVKERTQDFSKGSPCNKIEPEVKLDIDKTEWEKKVVQISKIFQKYPEIYESNITFQTSSCNQYFLDTEKNKSQRADLLTYIEISAKTQSEDGDPMEDFIGFYSRSPDEMPDISTISKAVETMAETLSLQVELEKEEDYSGPVLFTGQAAAVLFFQILGKGVSDPRSPLYENEMLTRGLSKDMGMLTKRIGRRVMRDFLSVYDDPGLTEWNNIPLVGHFSVDDQGVCAKNVEIVKEGRLTGVLMSRSPIKKITSSNGHGRYRNERNGARVCGMVGNLIIRSNDTKNQDELKSILINLCKDYNIPYGIIVTRLSPTKSLTQRERYMRYYSMSSGAEKTLLSSPTVAYKVDVKNGKVELIRGLVFSSITPRVLRDIVATGNEGFVHNFLYRDEEGNKHPMSVVAPSVLVEEMELETKATKSKKPPILSHPYFK